MKKMTLVIQYM